MKGFLIFLAVACPVVLLSPFFWSLVNMNFGAERIGYGHKTPHGMVTQWATLGPKAPWPAWALVPDGATLTVRSNFEAAGPGLNATGVGDFGGPGPAQAATERYQAALAQSGWRIRVARFDSLSPDIPPQPIHWCIVEARKGAQIQRLSIDIDDRKTTGSLWWTVGPANFPIGTSDKPCWS
jgi:hypothetical protein